MIFFSVIFCYEPALFCCSIKRFRTCINLVFVCVCVFHDHSQIWMTLKTMEASTSSLDSATSSQSLRRSGRNQKREDVGINLTEPFQSLNVTCGKNANACTSTVEGLAKKLMNTLNVSYSSTTEYDKKLSDVMSDLRNAGIFDSKYEESLKTVTNGLENAKLSKSPTRRSGRNTSRSPFRSKSPAERNGRSRSRVRGDRSRSRTPSKVMKKGLDFLRSSIRLSPKAGSSENVASTGSDEEKFYDAESSPNHHTSSKNKTEKGSNRTTSTPTLFHRPPLASVNKKDSRASNENVPQMQTDASTFKFNKDSDAKFSIGISPRSSTIGSPGSFPFLRSPSLRSSPASANQEFIISPLSTSSEPGSENTRRRNPSPSKVSSQTKKFTSAPPLFASPIPDQFHDPNTLIGDSTARVQPSPHNIMKDDIYSGAARHRQTAPSNMESAATMVAEEFKNIKLDPKTPYNQSQGTTSAPPNAAPDTVEPFVNKKTRNTATPSVIDTTDTMFKVDLHNKDSRTKLNQGKTQWEGSARSDFFKSSSSAFIGNHMNTNKTSRNTTTNFPDDRQSPSNGSTVSMDTSPFFSPPLQQQQNKKPVSRPLENSATGQQQVYDASFSQGFSNSVQFNLGIGHNQPPAATKIKTRCKRRDQFVRRPSYQRSFSSNQVSGPSGSSFDLNHNQAYQNDLSKKRMDITALREKGRSYYTNSKYKESTHVYTEAIEKYNIEIYPHVRGTHHLLALLFSNRAAALFMIGAYKSAVGDCRNAIKHAIDPRSSNPDLMSVDANPALWPKVYNRMARSHVKVGRVDDADNAFKEAEESASLILRQPNGYSIPNVKDGLEQSKTDAMLGRIEVSRLRGLLDKVNAIPDRINTKTKNGRDEATKALGHVTAALSIASGINDLHQVKIKLLADLKRWREVASHCERLASSNVAFDGCFVGDLSSNNPFPGVPIAKYLTADVFGKTTEDELKGAEIKLDKKASPDALLRLPHTLMPFYLRSLRLEERYYNSESCINKLEKFVSERSSVVGKSIYAHFSWLSEERDKLFRTRTEREKADRLFQNADYEGAGKLYAACLLIDSDSVGGHFQYMNHSSCAGGRLHAILHCNRAACFMAMKKFHEASTECTAALRIYPRYLKAILRRSRCYSRLDRIREAELDLKRWLEIVQQGRTDTYDVFISACIFDGPNTVSVEEEKGIKEELNELLKTKDRTEKEERARNGYRQHSQKSKSKSERFYSTTYTSQSSTKYNSQSPSPNAQRRREYFYNNQDSSRRWDSFKDQRPKSRSEKTGTKNSKNKHGNNSRSSSRPRAYANSSKEVSNHYTVLGLTRTTTADGIKKAYRKMAIKYHPGKNIGDPNAADNFRRVKDAYETLSDLQLKRKYDLDLDRGSF